MSNLQIKSGDQVSVNIGNTTINATKIVEPSTKVTIKGVIGADVDSHHTHDQNTSSATWTVAHNLGKKPSVTIVDSADSILHGQIQYTDLNNLTITLSAPTSGKAYLN